ncbi:MAG: DUF2163 domain-containing protein [Rhizobiaceae bacterium]
MIELPQALKDHVGLDVTSLAYCWTIVRNDGEVFGFTDHDEAITINGVTHDPQTGLNGTASEAELGMAVSSLDVEGALRSDKISADDLRSGKFNGAQVITTLVNWSDASQHVVLRKAKIGRCDINGNAFKAELQSLTEALDKRQGRLVRRNCDAQLGDQRCKKLVSSGAYQAVGTVSLVIGQSDLLVTGISSFDPQWFEGGEIEWLSGENAGTKGTVAMHDVSNGSVRISLWLPSMDAVAVGDSLRITAGCDKAFATCKAKFANELNFQGFPHLPGNDAVYSYVDGSGIFDGVPLVP